MKTLEDILAPKVEQVASEMDYLWPKWFEAIDVGALNMTDIRWCVIGQIAETRDRGYGTQFEAAKQAQFDLAVFDLAFFDYTDLGWDPEEEDKEEYMQDEDWDTLRILWAQEVKDRL